MVGAVMTAKSTLHCNAIGFPTKATQLASNQLMSSEASQIIGQE